MKPDLALQSLQFDLELAYRVDGRRVSVVSGATGALSQRLDHLLYVGAVLEGLGQVFGHLRVRKLQHKTNK